MKQRANLFLIFFLLPFVTFSQQAIHDIKGITVTQKTNSNFQEYFEVMVEQPLDHFNSTGKVFKQRVLVGYNSSTAPTVIETEGYSISNSSPPPFMKGCNYISVEHRYFGKSVPDSLDWTYLTIKQAASDLHHIRGLFGQIFTGKWMATGISKGGQTAIAYKMFFPGDVDATLAFVTPLKNGINDNRLSDYIKSIYKTECGEKIFAFQQFAFRNKTALLNEFDKYAREKNYTFNTLKSEKVFEYMLLEYPFAFYQNCFDCRFIPDTAATPGNVLEGIVSVVSPKFFSDAFRSKLEPSFYMFYHELGYYEYDLTPFKQWLASDNYPNAIFAPQNVTLNFDTTYLTSLNKFINSPTTEKLIFVYGEYDPYTSTRPTFDNNKNCLTIIAKNGCHKSRIADLTAEQQQLVFKQLSTWLQWPIGT